MDACQDPRSAVPLPQITGQRNSGSRSRVIVVDCAGAVRRSAGGHPLRGRRSVAAEHRDDRVRFDLVPRAVRCRVLPERQHVRPALHRPAVPGLVLPGELGAISRRRDGRVQPGHPLAAAEPRLVRGVPVRRVVYWAAVRSCSGVACPECDRAEPSCPCRSGRGGAQRHRRDLLPACCCCDRHQRLGESLRPTAPDGLVDSRRAGGWACRRDQAQLLAARRSLGDWTHGDCAEGGQIARSRCHWASGPGRRRLLVPAQPRPHGQPAALGQAPRPDFPTGPRAGAWRP